MSNEVVLHVELLRHGESLYEAFKAELRGESPAAFAPDLTSQGVGTMLKASETLSARCNDRKVRILCSPETRAIGSAEIVHRQLVSHGINAATPEICDDLDEAKCKSRQKLLKLVPLKFLRTYPVPDSLKVEAIKVRETLPDPDMDYAESWRNFAGKNVMPDLESPAQIAERLFHFLESLFNNPPCECVLAIAHNMNFDPLVEILFSEGLKFGRRWGLGNGEAISCDVYADGQMYFQFRTGRMETDFELLKELLKEYQ